MTENEHVYVEVEDVEDIDITWNEGGYKKISVKLKSGEWYVVESDS